MDCIENIFKKETNIQNEDAIYNEIVDDIIMATVKEAVQHFVAARSRDKLDDARYFYKKKEVDMFYKLFTGDPKSLVCNPVYDDHGDFLCWEIVRKSYFKEAKDMRRSCYYGKESA